MVGGGGGEGEGKDSKDKGGWEGGRKETFPTAEKKVAIFT
jgi:hypothetical protein